MTDIPDHISGCSCPACTGGGTGEAFSLDPYAGGTYGDKPIWDVAAIAANLNRTGYSWKLNNYGELGDGVLNYGFWKSYDELANSYYVNEVGDDAFSEVDPETFSVFNADQIRMARSAITLWDDLVSISFQETRSGAADLVYGNTSTGGAQAYAYLPFGSTSDDYYEQFGIQEAGRLGGDVWIDGFVASNFQPTTASYYAWLTMVHETGHALGLSHPGNYNATDDDDGDGVADPITYANDAAYAQDSLQYSVMSYFDALETGAQHIDWTLLNFAYASTPLVHDVAVIQDLYGADMTTRTGDDVYGFKASRDLRGGVFDFTVNTRPILTVWDAGGTDTINFSGWDTDSIIDLNQGGFSSGGGTAAFLTLEQVNAARTALGLAPRSQAAFDYYEDLKELLGLTSGLFTDNISIAYGAVVENAVGGGGNDLLIANEVANRLSGGLGTDTVSYQAATAGVVVSLLGTGGTGYAAGDVFVSVENLTGSAFDDVLAGNGVANLFTGGDGFDTVTYADATRAVTVSLADGGTSGSAAGDRFAGVEKVVGSAFADVIAGDALANTLDGGAGNDRLTGGAGGDTFLFRTSGTTGSDRIADFGATDVLVTDKAIALNARGIAASTTAGAVVLDGTDGDRAVIDGLGTSGLRFLGTEDGLSYYGDAGIRPVAGTRERVFEGTVGDDTLVGSGTAVNYTDVFFYDTASAAPGSGDDRITFTARDLLVTTTALVGDPSPVAGSVFFADGVIDLTGHGGTILATNPNGVANAFELDGAVVNDGVTYYVYSQVGSAVGTADLYFA